MKIHFYETEIQESNCDAKQLLKSIEKLSLEERDKEINDKPVCLENIKFDDDFICMDFTQRRLTHGPGYASKGKKTKDFDFSNENNAAFGKQTAAIWSLKFNCIAIQYNVHGIRPGAIARYLALFLKKCNEKKSQIIFSPVLTKDIIKELERSEMVLGIECTIDISSTNNNTVFETVSLDQLSSETGTTKVAIKLFSERGGHLKNILSSVKGLLDRSNTKGLKATVKLDDKTTVLDLLNARFVEEVSNEPLDSTMTGGRRWTAESRIEQIKEKLKSYLDDLEKRS